MIKGLSGMLILLLLTATLRSQGDSELIDFQGGKYTFEFTTLNNLNLGVGSRVGAMGGDYAGLFPSSESVLWNPANLAFMNHSQWTIDLRPPLVIDPAAFTDLDAEIHSAVDDGIQDIKGTDFIMTDARYPELSLKMGARGNFGSGSFAIKSRYFTIAGAVYKPFEFDLNLIGTGMEARIKTGEPGSALEVAFFSAIDLSVSANLRIQGMSIGFGRMITPEWSAGASFERLSGVADVTARFLVEGIMVTAGNERTFNDPNDPWYNDLHSSISGHFNGNCTGITLGSTYKFGKTWGVGAVLSMTNALEMNGQMQIIQHSLPGLNLEAEKDEDLLDPTHEDFDISSPTKTRLLYNPTGDLLILNLPSSVGLGTGGKLGFLGISVNYARYFGEMSYEYAVDRNGTPIPYSRGLALSNGFRLGLDFKYLRLCGGVLSAQMIDEVNESSETDGSTFLIPNFCMSTGFRILQRLRADIVLVAMPSGIGKISFSYDM
ncbi:hypothetical protein JXJ21_07320 [candidate division KSB1 bacterium]|nr:hypothetical protein [candidate division KSB1 bacterium]